MPPEDYVRTLKAGFDALLEDYRLLAVKKQAVERDHDQVSRSNLAFHVCSLTMMKQPLALDLQLFAALKTTCIFSDFTTHILPLAALSCSRTY